jgi:3-oxoacyl-[acyl-carrier-protein] synthase I
MRSQSIAIVRAGLVSSVGLTAAASCAAIRASMTNPTETRFMGSDGEWIMAHQVQLEKPWRGRTKLVKMAAMAIHEALDAVAKVEPATLPLMLCIAERDRPGRLDGLDENLFAELEQELGIQFHPTLSAVIPQGRVSVAIALAQARKVMEDNAVDQVLIAATDSLLAGPTLSAYGAEDRLLTQTNSNGFMPGEAGGAILVTRHPGQAPTLVCDGVGFATEKATLDSGAPLRAEGLTQAIKQALADAACEMHDLDFRITDNSGEQYYFKEASLALSRTLRKRKETFDIWHPADCIGEVGAAVGTASLAVILAACRKTYTLGNRILIHAGNDAGRRGAAVLRYQGAA